MAEKMPVENLLAQETIGKFQLIAELGHGAMADVFLAVARGPVGFSKLQVLKVLRGSHAEVPEVFGLFLDEARLAARLNHPNVVQTSEVCHEESRVYLVMEYLEGQTLERVLRRARRQGGLPLMMHLRALADALAGLHHAHELCDFDGTPLRVVHRSVSPENLFLTYDGPIKVVDFGIAKAATASVETQGGVLKGKVGYMAPEQAMGLPVDRRADLFSVGVLLWEAATGAKFWGERGEIQILHHLSQGDLPTLRVIPAGFPPRLLPICLKALAVDPAQRYASAAEMQADLEALLQADSHAVSAREVGEKVAELFADKRAEVRELIEQQLNGLRLTGKGGNLLPPSRFGQTGASPTHRESSTAGHERRISHSTSPVAGVRPSSSSTMFAVGAMATGFLVLAVMAIRALTSPIDVRTTTARLDALHPQDLAVVLRASPVDARMFLDDIALNRNPFEGRLPRDGATHRLLVTAPNHEPHAELLTFDGDLSREITLLPLAAASPTAPAPPPEPHAASSAPPASRVGVSAHGGALATATAAASAASPSAAASGVSPPPAVSAADPPLDESLPPPRAPHPGVRQLDRDDPWAAPGGSAAPGP
jgi:serine/threonine-protein kinase